MNLSIQTKLGIKVNIIFDRLGELWNGTTDEINLNTKKVRIKQNVQTHMPSQADYLDNSMIQTDMYPPAPVSNNKTSNNSSYDMMMRGGGGTNQSNNMIGGGLGDYGVMAANSVIGGSFGSMFQNDKETQNFYDKQFLNVLLLFLNLQVMVFINEKY